MSVLVFLLEMAKLGIGNLRLHMLRSVLTALGIILGVAAVITMVAVGEGSKQQALMQIERLGARNVIIRSQKPPQSNEAGGGGQRRSFISSYGITRADYRLLQSSFPPNTRMSQLKAVGGEVSNGNRRKASQSFGVTPDLLDAANLRVDRGRYLTEGDLDQQAAVCVIGTEVAKELFPFDDPLGSTLRIDNKTLRVVGVLAPVGLSGGAGAALVGRDLNLDVHLPITSAKALFGDTIVRRESGSFNASKVELSEVYLVAPDREEVIRYSQIARRVMELNHRNLEDIGLIVPYELLAKARKDALTWNLVLGAIASISLLVGGIGIMNIMLATVTERTREIGIRRALGATRRHIIWQFIVETGVLSTIGGLVGVALGVSAAVLLPIGAEQLPRLPLLGGLFPSTIELTTQVTTWSIAAAFSVAACTGLVFGIYPALKAASQDPIVALRHD